MKAMQAMILTLDSELQRETIAVRPAFGRYALFGSIDGEMTPLDFFASRDAAEQAAWDLAPAEERLGGDPRRPGDPSRGNAASRVPGPWRRRGAAMRNPITARRSSVGAAAGVWSPGPRRCFRPLSASSSPTRSNGSKRSTRSSGTGCSGSGWKRRSNRKVPAAPE